jgi:hypothetical protein
MRLTRPNIARLLVPPGKSELIVFDDALPGFGIRLRSSGTRVWIAQYRTGAKQRRVTLGSVEVLDPDEARRAAKATLAKAQLGADPQAEKAAAKARAKQTLGNSIETYLLGHAKGRLKANTFRDVSRYLRVSWKPLHELPLHQVDRRAIASCLSVIAAESGGTSANRSRTTLSAFFSWAMREGLADVNPTVGTHTFDELTRERVLTNGEIAAVWNACRIDHYGSIVKLLILTGQRRLEIGEVTRTEIDLPGRRIRLPGARTKNVVEQVRASIEHELAFGGELIPADEVLGAIALRDTLERPDAVAADASRARLELAHRAGVLETALDAADTMEASNSFEKMLTHQLGLMHHLTMKMGAQAIRHVERLGQANLTHAEAQRISTEAARLGNATARMTVTYQQGMTTLQRLGQTGPRRSWCSM